MNLTALPAFTDNYIWMLDDGHHAVVVDPGDSAPVLAALEARQLVLAAILVTHHHADHVGGVDALRAHFQGPVYGPKRERIPTPLVPLVPLGPVVPLVHGEHVDVLGWRFEVIDVSSHTRGHIAYFTAPLGAAPVLFGGDTLFSGACARLFEGTSAQIHHSLSLLGNLPGATRVCRAHEYTLSNLKFARAVEPANVAPAAYTTCCEPAVADSAREHGAPSNEAVAVLAALREWKNEFR